MNCTPCETSFDLPTSPLSFDRHRTRFGNIKYSCRECSQVATSIAAIEHAPNCSVKPDATGLFLDDVTADQIGAPLSDNTLELVNDVLYRVSTRNSPESSRYDLDGAQKSVAEHAGVNWTATGSTARFTASLGKTNQYGSFHLPDQRPLVLKVDPNIRFSTDFTPISGNFDELRVWEIASQEGDQDLFANVIAAAPDGSWALVNQCLPIDVRVNDSHHSHRDYIYDEDREYIDPLRAELKKRRWTQPDWKNGNVGLSPHGHPVLLDSGTGLEHENHSIEQPL